MDTLKNRKVRKHLIEPSKIWGKVLGQKKFLTKINFSLAFYDPKLPYRPEYLPNMVEATWHGDVWMYETGLLEFIDDVTAYRGRMVTVRMNCEVYMAVLFDTAKFCKTHCTALHSTNR